MHKSLKSLDSDRPVAGGERRQTTLTASHLLHPCYSASIRCPTKTIESPEKRCDFHFLSCAPRKIDGTFGAPRCARTVALGVQFQQAGPRHLGSKCFAPQTRKSPDALHRSFLRATQDSNLRPLAPEAATQCKNAGQSGDLSAVGEGSDRGENPTNLQPWGKTSDRNVSADFDLGAYIDILAEGLHWAVQQRGAA
jgi:hypothetical protein